MKIGFFCINLPARQDRWKKVSQEFENVHLDIEKFVAISIKKCPSYGCTLSHRSIIEMAKKRNYDAVCVFEDDVVFSNPKKFQYNLAELIENVPDKWQLIYLGCGFARNAELKKSGLNIYQMKGGICTHGIIYHKNIFQTILDRIPVFQLKKTNKGYIEGIDTYDNWLAQVIQKEYPSYVRIPFLVNQNSDYSDIDKSHKKTKYYFKFLSFMYARKMGFIMKFIGYIGDIFHISLQYQKKKKN